MRFKTSKIKMLKIPLLSLTKTPAKVIGEALTKLHPDTKMVGAHDGIHDANMTWYFTNPAYPDVQDGMLYPEINIMLGTNYSGETEVVSVDEGFPTSITATQAVFGGLYGLPNNTTVNPVAGPILPSNSTSPLGAISKTWAKAYSDAMVDALVYGSGNIKAIWDDGSVPTKCECGVDASKSGGNHSDWCPKYGA